MKPLLLLATLVLLWAAGCERGALTEPPVNKSVQSPRPAAPQAALKKIVLLGDSLARGTGDEMRRGIGGRLEDEFRQRGLPVVEVVNLGVNGAQTADVAARLSQSRIREDLADAGAIVLSVGANDLFRTRGSREQTMRAPLAVAEGILTRITEIVAELRRINPNARILIIGGYNPVPNHEHAATINRYLGLWDESLAAQFEDDPLVTVVKMSDVVTPARLSRYDSFHPGGEAYSEASRRIAAILLDPPASR